MLKVRMWFDQRYCVVIITPWISEYGRNGRIKGSSSTRSDSSDTVRVGSFFTLCFLDSSLGCSHSDAEKVISTLVQHSPDLRERIIFIKNEHPGWFSPREAPWEQRCSINSKQSLSLSVYCFWNSNCESALDQVLNSILIPSFYQSSLYWNPSLAL